MRWMRERLNREEGFTLIELMVVVLIIAVLVAIAVPSFLGFRNRAQDRSAQSDVRNVLLAEKAYWTDYAKFVAGDAAGEAGLKEYEPGIEVVNTAVASITAADPVTALLSVGSNDDAVCLEKMSDSGNYFAIFEDASSTGGTFYQGATSSVACPTSAGAPSGWSTSGFPSP